MIENVWKIFFLLFFIIFFHFFCLFYHFLVFFTLCILFISFLRFHPNVECVNKAVLFSFGDAFLSSPWNDVALDLIGSNTTQIRFHWTFFDSLNLFWFIETEPMGKVVEYLGYNTFFMYHITFKFIRSILTTYLDMEKSVMHSLKCTNEHYSLILNVWLLKYYW